MKKEKVTELELRIEKLEEYVKSLDRKIENLAVGLLEVAG